MSDPDIQRRPSPTGCGPRLLGDLKRLACRGFEPLQGAARDLPCRDGHGSPVPARRPDGWRHRHTEYSEQRAQLEAMDAAMGRIMDALDIKGVSDDTLVGFLNDNRGTRKAGEKRPCRGRKEQCYEGGNQVEDQPP